MTYLQALESFVLVPASAGWRELPFFARGAAADICTELDRRVSAGAEILPAPPQIFNALALCPLASTRAVILGQDPYPTPGDAHGLAFSYAGSGRTPASLKRILRELADDLEAPAPESGNLSNWARQGVLLLNTALSVEAGKAGAHLRLGWNALAEQAIAALSATQPAVSFILWGDRARAQRHLIDRRHLIIESAHPSPLAARGDFLGSRPFNRTNAFLEAKGIEPINWLAA